MKRWTERLPRWDCITRGNVALVLLVGLTLFSFWFQDRLLEQAAYKAAKSYASQLAQYPLEVKAVQDGDGRAPCETRTLTVVSATGDTIIFPVFRGGANESTLGNVKRGDMVKVDLTLKYNLRVVPAIDVRSPRNLFGLFVVPINP